MSITRIALCISLSFLAFSPISLSQNSDSVGDAWLQWRGPSRDGQFNGTDWPGALEDHLNLIWKQEIGEGYSGPIVTQDKVITFETQNRQSEVVRAFDKKTGESVWEQQWNSSMKVPFFAAKRGSWVRSTPVSDGRYLFLGGMRENIICLRVEDGEDVWRVDLSERYGTSVPGFGFACSPLLHEGGLYLQAAESFIKLEASTGKEVWRTLVDKGNESPFSSPIMTTLAGKEQLVILMRHHLSGIDPENGGVLWQEKVEAFRGMNILTPLSIGNSVFTAAYGGRSHLFDVSDEGESFGAKEEWSNRLQGNMCSPVLVDGHLFFVGRNNRFNCVVAQTGAIKYVSGKSFGDYQSLVAQGDKILGLDGSGKLYLYRANPNEFELLDEVQISDEESWAHLAVTNERLYIRSLKSIAVYEWK